MSNYIVLQTQYDQTCLKEDENIHIQKTALPINIHNPFKKGSLSPGLRTVKEQESDRFRAALYHTAKSMPSSLWQTQLRKRSAWESGRKIHPQHRGNENKFLCILMNIQLYSLGCRRFFYNEFF